MARRLKAPIAINGALFLPGKTEEELQAAGVDTVRYITDPFAWEDIPEAVEASDAPASSGGSAPRPPAPALPGEFGNEALEAMLASDLDKLGKTELVALAKFLGAPPTGNKGDVLASVKTARDARNG